MTIFEEHAAGLAEIEADMPQIFSWDGADYPCTLRATRKGNDPIDGGTWLTALGSLTVRRAVLPSIPKEGAKISVGHADYTVISVTEDESIPVVRIEYGKIPKP